MAVHVSVAMASMAVQRAGVTLGSLLFAAVRISARLSAASEPRIFLGFRRRSESRVTLPSTSLVALARTQDMVVTEDRALLNAEDVVDHAEGPRFFLREDVTAMSRVEISRVGLVER